MLKKLRPWHWLAIIVAVLLVAGFIIWNRLDNRPSQYESEIPVYTPSATPEPSETPSATPLSVPEGCNPDPSPIVGTSISIDDRQSAMPLMSLGLASDGSPATPPGSEGYTIAWYNQGPAVGSDQGNVVLTAHTFNQGGALGNDLNDGLLSEGDIFRISNGTDDAVCYRFTHALKVYVADYDPDSDVLYNDNSDPQIVLVVCSDYPAGGGDPLARVLYYAELVKAS